MKTTFILKMMCPLLAGIFFVQASMARIYYVSSSYTGTTSNGNLATPWKSLSMVQSNMSLFNPGDTISFLRGDDFIGTLTLSRSGTSLAPIVFNTYGTGNAPRFIGTGASMTYLIYLYNRNYIVFDGFEITDPGLSLTDRWQLSRIQRAFGFDGTSTGNVIKNCKISLVGIGTYWVGPGNTMTNCDVGNLRMVVNNVGGDNDYGANPIVISSANNKIFSNFFHDCWANSYDYTYDGGAVEFYGNGASNNFIAYNTFYDCNGVAENGSGNGGTIENNLFCYNKFINNGSLFYINNSGTYLVTVKNLQFYNNVIVENVVNRLLEANMGSMSVSVSTTGIVIFKNNVFQLSTGVDVVRSGQWTSGQLVHENNVYKLSNNSILNFPLNSNEISTSQNFWTNTITSNPFEWDYTPLSGSLLIDFGNIVGLTRDYLGNNIMGNPDAGIIERQTVSTLSVTATFTPILCNGQSSQVTINASGGIQPYTGTGYFSRTAGNYSFIVGDASGQKDTVILTITQPSSLSLSYTAGVISSFGGTTSVTINGSGGVSPYLYSMDGSPFQTTNIFNNVAEGTHILQLKDQNNCVRNDTIQLYQSVLSILDLQILEKQDLSCKNANDGLIRVNGVGGSYPYTYAINNGGFSSDSIFRSISPGTYTVYVKDSYGQRVGKTVGIKNSRIKCSTRKMGFRSIDLIRKSLWARIFPNPSSKSFHVNIVSDIHSDVLIDVFDENGKVVYQHICQTDEDFEMGDEFLAGLYFMRINQAGIIKSFKLMKQ